jgi:signal transduction histidine kinase
VELLLDQLPDLSGPELSELLSSLRLGVWRLQTLIDNLLEAASLEAGSFHVFAHSVNVREIVAEAVFTMKPLLERRDQHLVLNAPEVLPLVRADFRRTVQVLVNLLGNASEYGPDGETISVRVSVPDAAWVRLSVTDQGPGIPDEVRTSLSCQLMGADGGTGQRAAGHGLGLTVVKAVVVAQGGTMGLARGTDGGTEAWFTLPIQAVDDAPEEA